MCARVFMYIYDGYILLCARVCVYFTMSINARDAKDRYRKYDLSVVFTRRYIEIEKNAVSAGEGEIERAEIPDSTYPRQESWVGRNLPRQGLYRQGL